MENSNNSGLFIASSESITTGGHSDSSINISSTSTSLYDTWGTPERIAVNEVGEKIEMIYKQSPNIVYSTWPTSRPDDRVFKIVYSCKDGKWHKSNPIYGKIIPAQGEYYQFEG